MMMNISLALRTQLLSNGQNEPSHQVLVAENLLNLVNTTRANLTRDTVTESASAAAAATEVTTVLYDRHLPKYSQATLVTLCVLLGCMIVATVLGNVFVITAILVERSLQGVSNYLVLSLAVTDLLVAVLVMPLSLLNEVSVHWYLGRALCDMWVSMDVLCCTASILHLVAIAVDRFWAVSNIDYVRRRCARQILVMITIVWLVSVAISIPPLFGWRHESDNPELSGVCMISQDHGYTIFSTVGAFYCPLVLMLVLNFKIYRAARYRIRRKGFMQRPRLPSHIPVPAVHVEQETTAQATNRNSSDSDASHDGISVYNPSCVVNHELSRADVGLDSSTGEYDRRDSYYPGESTSDSNPCDSYYPVSTEDPDPEPLPTFPSFTLSATSSDSDLCGDPGPSGRVSPVRTRPRTLSAGHVSLREMPVEHVPDPHLLRVPSPHHLQVPSPHLLTVPVPHHMTVPSPHLLSVPSPHHLTVPSPHHLTVPSSPHHLTVPSSPHHLTVPSPHHLAVPTPYLPSVPTAHLLTEDAPHIEVSHSRHGADTVSHPLALSHAKDTPDSEAEDVLFPECSRASTPDPNQLSVPCSPRRSISDISRRSSWELEPLNLEDPRHFAEPESTVIEEPDPDEIIVPVSEAPVTTESKLVQFNSRVKVEGNTDSSETSNSLKPGEDEYGAADSEGLEESDALQERMDSVDDLATICCASKSVFLELSCLPTRNRVEEERSRSSSKEAGSENVPRQQVPVLEVPVVTIRKDSCSHYMSESRCLTPAFQSSSSPSTTTTNTSGTSSSQGGTQLLVPQLAPIPPTPQPGRSRGNNNTRRARNREKEKQRREKLEMRRERKAARVLGIITGAFVLCWLPFFILALVGPFLPIRFRVPQVLISLFLWLGYFNSLLNPIIYTVFNPSFRTAFRKIFFKRLKSVTRS